MKIFVIVLCVIMLVLIGCEAEPENWVSCPDGYVQTSEQSYNLHTWYKYDGKLIIGGTEVTVSISPYETYSYVGEDCQFKLTWNGNIVCIKRGE